MSSGLGTIPVGQEPPPLVTGDERRQRADPAAAQP